MIQEVKLLLRSDTVMFEYEVHDMERAVQWYRDMFGFEIIYGPTSCHTEFALPLDGARLALSLTDESVNIHKGSRIFLPTHDVQTVETVLKQKGARTSPIQNTEGVVLILWVEDPDGNFLAIEQWVGR
jgi:predicted enzyme related to lactoylglutathione lyase